MGQVWIFFAALLACSGTPAWARFEPVTCKNSFTVEQEITEGNKVAAQVWKEMPVLPDSSPTSRYIQQLGAKLVAQAPPSPGTTERWPFNFHVVASEEINAFALPGGSVFVNLGTIQAAQTEAQLAGVMAHELSHVVMRHSTCNLTKQRNRSMLYGLGAIGSAILLGNGAAGQLAQTGLGLGQSLDFLHMSRDYEKQADLLGANILYQAGYDPRGLPQFFEVIQAKYGAGGAQLLSDHPNPGNRTEYVNAEIQTLPQRSGSTVTSAAFKDMHAQSMGMRALTAKEVQGGAWKRSGQYASGPGGGGVVRVADAPLPAGAPANPAATGETSRQAPSGPLSPAQLGLGGGTTVFEGPRFSLRHPARWSVVQGQNGDATIAPEGGAGDAGVAYGVILATVPAAGRGTATLAGLSDATKALVQQLLQGNAGASQAGQITSTVVGSQSANTLDLRGVSPLGASIPERDWVVTVARPDGAMNYLVFVAPERDFEGLRPAFQAMLDSFRPL